MNVRQDHPGWRPTVLLVGNHPLIQQVMWQDLLALGCDVKLVSTAAGALSIEMDTIDLVFLDIGLPDLPGTEVSRVMRQRHLSQRLPIIAITTHGEVNLLGRAGIDGVIQKPISRTQLAELLAVWLPKYE